MAIDLVSLPTGVKFTDQGVTDAFDGSVNRLGGGRFESNVDPDYAYQVWRVRSIPVSATVAAEMRTFFRERRGDKGYGFLFTDPLDSTFIDSNIGTGDGSTTTFQLRKQYGTTRPYYHPVPYPEVGSLTIKVNGVEVDISSDYTVSSTGLITFTVAPTGGHAITASCTGYDKAVRFASDLEVGVVQGLDENGTAWLREIRVTIEEVNPL